MKSRARVEFVEFYTGDGPGFSFKWFALNCIRIYFLSRKQLTINWTLFSYCCKDTLPDIQHQPQHNQPYKSWSRSAHLPHKLVGRSLYRHNHCYMDIVPDIQHWLQHRRTDRSWSRSGCWSHKLGQTLLDICRRRLWWWWCLDNFPLYEHL